MSAGENRALIEGFYDAFGRRDGAAMAACYAREAHFFDPAFGDLHGDEVGAMWRMLTARATDLSIELPSHDADETSGRANWIATYSFGPHSRRVVNEVEASFRFRDGLIADHRDDFDFRRWAGQALGPAGLAVALLPPLRARARARARAQLEEFRRNEGESPAGA